MQNLTSAQCPWVNCVSEKLSEGEGDTSPHPELAPRGCLMFIIPFLHICLQASLEHFKSVVLQDSTLDPSPCSSMIWLKGNPRAWWLGKPENVLGRLIIPRQTYVISLALISGSRQQLSRSADLSGCRFRIVTRDEDRGRCKGFVLSRESFAKCSECLGRVSDRTK